MSAGFVTASGKGITVSEKALEKARELFRLLDNEDSAHGIEENAQGTSFKALKSSPLPSLCYSPQRSSKRIASTFKSPVVKNPDETRNVTPIKLLTPYCKNWRLCIKITSVDEAFFFLSNQIEFLILRFYRGSHMFSFIAVDESGVEIRFSAFGDVACKTATLIHVEHMYYITRASVKMTNRKYNRNQHDMEVVLQQDTEIAECTDRPLILSPKVNFEFVHIQNLQNFVDMEIDVLGIIIGISEMKQLSSKKGEELQKREIQIVDNSGYYVNISLWGQKAISFSEKHYQQILAAKGLLVRCFQDSLSLVSLSSSKLLLDPHFMEADRLRFWYAENRNKTFNPVSTNHILSCKLVFVIQLHEHKWIGQLKFSVSGQCFNVTAMITSIFTENAVYKGCISCKKKLLVEKDGDSYICSKCGICNEYKYCYTLRASFDLDNNMELVDFTGAAYVTVFDDCAQKLIGEEADEVAKFLKFNEEKYHSCFKKVLFKPYIFRLDTKKRGNRDSSAVSMKLKEPFFWLVKDLTPTPFDSYCTFLQQSFENACSRTAVRK
ncbi:unnamed protein product [Thelazia callipaeda]|uniref:Replication protein A 70 kDa DNA-binding subunit n=1 Tax=Thelazia callipaeda TaxID=103827 RepID=A0A0N5CJL2_THECL|nr:unnamed protein product [Thelazia callipaeda]